MRTLRIATRKSPLALWQAEYVKANLLKHHPQLTIELVTFTTQGDKILDTPLAKIGGKGLFVKELEVAMLEGRADLAVHSMKDVPMDCPEGLAITVICEREDPTDALVSNRFSSLAELPQGAIVGTSSLRRQCQLRALRPDLVTHDLRGNVGTRLGRLDHGEYDAAQIWIPGHFEQFAVKDHSQREVDQNGEEPDAIDVGNRGVHYLCPRSPCRIESAILHNYIDQRAEGGEQGHHRHIDPFLALLYVVEAVDCNGM